MKRSPLPQMTDKELSELTDEQIHAFATQEAEYELYESKKQEGDVVSDETIVDITTKVNESTDVNEFIKSI